MSEFRLRHTGKLHCRRVLSVVKDKVRQPAPRAPLTARHPTRPLLCVQRDFTLIGRLKAQDFRGNNFDFSSAFARAR
jgi:hypothetical protein